MFEWKTTNEGKKSEKQSEHTNLCKKVSSI